MNLYDLFSLASKAKVNDRTIISPPQDFHHVIHVGFNAETGEFTVITLRKLFI